MALWPSLFGYAILPALFERFAPPRWLLPFRRTANSLYLPWAGVAPGWAVIETIGRRSGEPRQTPVGGRLSGDRYWLVAIDGRHAQYVRNIEVNPKVRIRIHGRWLRTGVAAPLA